LITAAWVATFSQAASSAGACLTASPIAAQWGWTIPPGNPQPASDSDGRAIGAPARIPGMPPLTFDDPPRGKRPVEQPANLLTAAGCPIVGFVTAAARDAVKGP